MKDIGINITKARIINYAVTFKDMGELPSVYVNIGLYTDSGTKISEYSIQSDSYLENRRFELSVEMVDKLLSMSEVLEHIVTKHCQNSCKQLKSG